MTTTNAVIDVVLLDDHDLVLAGLVRTLEREGFEVVVATTAVESALAAVREYRPDLCVLDLRLQDGRSAIDLLPTIRESAPKTAIAILTSFEDGAAASAAIAAGATGYIIKDAERVEICRQLRSVAVGDLVIDRRVASAVLGGTTEPPLTPRECEILHHIAAGATNREIAAQLHLSPHTIKDYVARLLRKLDCHTRAELLMVAIREGLIEPDERSSRP